MSVIVFWLAVGLLAYAYLGYPLLILAWATFRPRRHRECESEPPVSLLVVAHNERVAIGAKIRNCLSIDYPKDRLQIIVASDGSSDDTVRIARSFESQGIDVVAFGRHCGKAAVLNHVVPQLRGEIVMLADARQRVDAAALRTLVRPFADPHVGAVSGELMLNENAASCVGGGVGFYWRYEKLIRRSESAVDSTIGATGALYAIRRALFVPIPEDTILDDVLVPLRIAQQGYRILFDRRARVFDRVVASSRQELSRKARTIAGTFQLFARERWLFNPLRNRLWFQTVSHKALRLLLPPLHLAALMANANLLDESPVYLWTFAGQVTFYATALAGYAARGRRYHNRLLSVPYALCLLSWATVIGFLDFIRGIQTATWEPTRIGGDPQEDLAAGLNADTLAAE
jgi:poly-beta-1,6-N-acetyl-D-glucosamine synthase